ncbi:DUF4157 domain-containing protein [Streptomyces sp. NPDC048420]|uniref:eCIS core domain-containing protein n=1 Tax=Streptomyces sp. NPDC048420 TaxID=3155755 RepID=UPI00342EBF32
MSLPYRSRLEERFGRPLDSIPVYSGPQVGAALDGYDALAAVQGGCVFLADREPDLRVVTHEVVHALQRAVPGGGSVVVEPGAAAEREAVRVADSAAFTFGAAQAPLSVEAALPWQAVALLRRSPSAGGMAQDEGPPVPVEAAHGPEMDAARLTPAVLPTSTALPAPPVPPALAALSPPTASPAPAVRSDPAALPAVPTALGEVPAPAAEKPAPASAAQWLRAFATAPPTAKAQQASGLGNTVARLADDEARSVPSGVPELRARSEGAAAPPGPTTVTAPAPRTIDVSGSSAAPAPRPQIQTPPPLAAYTPPQDVYLPFNGLTTAAPEVVADRIDVSLSAVPTQDPDLRRSLGAAPEIALTGDQDPARLTAAQSAAHEEAGTAGAEAARAVLEGPGAERVQPRDVDEGFAVGELVVQPVVVPLAEAAQQAPVDGPQAYLALGLPAEVQASFDRQQAAAMQRSATGVAEQVEAATSARDQARQAAVSEAESATADLNESARQQQADAVSEARDEIRTARWETLEAQTREVDRVASDAETRRQADEECMRTRVADDRQRIHAEYAGAQTRIDAHVTEGERRAAEEKDRAERAAEEESWWDRAVGWVRAAFQALVRAIGVIFDAVRAAVNAVLDAVKAAVLALIDGVAAFLREAIAVFAGLLKAAVEGLLGRIFPELARALTRLIDQAAARATRAVDDVANGLKAGVQALTEKLRTALLATIDAFRSAVTTAITVIGAVVTGDWGTLAQKALEAVLALLGVEPSAFYAFVGRARETWQIIVSWPGAFLGHVLDAVSGGVRGFGQNLGTHLQAGLVGWLTGALGGAGIVVPRTFDVMGVLDLARQILGLTWDRLRVKAARLIGEKNVERLTVVYEFLSTLVTQGWSALWARIMDSVGTVRDTVFGAIRTFLVERVVRAAITKLASLFSPVGALVQLVLSLWNLYTFLRDQLRSLGELVASVVNAIGDIARGLTGKASTAVEGVLARLLPLAIDLLARLLGLGGVGDKVREIVERIRGVVDRGIEGLLRRAAGAFGSRKGGSSKKAAAGPKSPTVKRDALAQAARRLTAGQLSSPDQIADVVATVFKEFRQRGLTSLRFDIVEATTLKGRLVAAASPPEQRVIEWTEIFGVGDPAKALFTVQPRNETHAAIAFNGERQGEVAPSDRNRHAEQNLLDRYWHGVVARAREAIAENRNAKPVIAVAINRAPCRSCTTKLVNALNAVEESLKKRVRFVLTPTGLYEPTEALEASVIDAQRKELGELAKKLGRSKEALIRERLNRVQLTDDKTTFGGLVQLATAGWELSQLKAKSKQTVSGRIFAEAAHTAMERVKRARAGTTS